MEKNHDNLKKAVNKLPGYEPDEKIWMELDAKLDAQPLTNALHSMPEYEPDELLWELIEAKASKKRTSMIWWYAAAMLAVGLSIGLLIYGKDSRQPISYSIEKVDSRLQNEEVEVTNAHYARLKAYCETETLVCNSKDYKRLQQEYEKLNNASDQLQQAIGEYNTEAELIRQFTILEEQKAGILNEMAKMI